jgi:hypothetical protein
VEKRKTKKTRINDAKSDFR